ncbi:MAG: carbohydrate porin [Planctomycetes bacterium]|nr:carbohydrate porin [Planctomycetota bacterium]
MKFIQAAIAAVAAVALFSQARADETGGSGANRLWRQETLSNNWFGLGGRLADNGVSVKLGLTQIFQANVRGGISTHRRSGRYTGSYDLEIELDAEKLLKLPGGNLLVAGKGGWSEGIDEPSVGSLFGVNDDAAGYRSFDVTELWYEQALLEDAFRLRFGKIDLTGGFEHLHCMVAFDANAYANDETSQFLNSALVNNPTIPFGDKGLGAIAYLRPAAWTYFAAGVADANADSRETGFRTTFGGSDDFLGIFETGLVPNLQSTQGPLPGAYRVGLWYDPQPKAHIDGRGVKRDDVGCYLSFDQLVLKENADQEDAQGLGLFARYGWADGDFNTIKSFWSAGAQYAGLVPTRDQDVLGFGLAQGRLSRYADPEAFRETVMELYYNACVAPWLSVSPSMQYVFNAGGSRNSDDAIVIGLRLQMSF